MTTKPQPMTLNGNNRTITPTTFGTSPKTTFIRRSSSAADGNLIQVRGNVNDMREHLKHLGPSNLASRPKMTRYQAVKIKPAHSVYRSDSRTDSVVNRGSIQEPYNEAPAAHGGEGEGLLKSAGKDASDGVQALQQGYGSTDRTVASSPKATADTGQISNRPLESAQKSLSGDRSLDHPADSDKIGSHSDGSSDTLGSLNSSRSSSHTRKKKRGTARSGSITENIIEAGGVRKVVLETNNSSSDDRDERSKENTLPTSSTPLLGGNSNSRHDGGSTSHKGEEVKKKRRRIRKKKGGKGGEASVAGDD